MVWPLLTVALNVPEDIVPVHHRAPRLYSIGGSLRAAQGRQVSFVRRSAEGMIELVNELLDPAKTSELDFKPTQVHRTREVRVSAMFDDQPRQFSVEAVYPSREAAAEPANPVYWGLARVAFRLPRHRKGTGLRLPCYLGEIWCGRLILRSASPAASAFRRYIPAWLAPKQLETDPFAHRKADALAVVSQPDRPRRVLAINDEEPWRYVLRQVLGCRGPFRVRLAEVGVDGRRLAWCCRPDDALLDHGLDDRDGSDMIGRQRAEEVTARLPSKTTLTRPEMQYAPGSRRLAIGLVTPKAPLQ